MDVGGCKECWIMKGHNGGRGNMGEVIMGSEPDVFYPTVGKTDTSLLNKRFALGQFAVAGICSQGNRYHFWYDISVWALT